jgi:rhodanese-related sulfurtransferase
MDEIEAIKKAAAERAKAMDLPYAGALLPKEAHALMRKGAKLVDVRTRAELAYVGRVPGSLAVEWQTFPGNKPNPQFLEQLAEVTSKEDAVMFICRSGARSHHTAAIATEGGWNECYNVLEGFEGDIDENHHRNTIGGWRVAGLPWVQS